MILQMMRGKSLIAVGMQLVMSHQKVLVFTNQTRTKNELVLSLNQLQRLPILANQFRATDPMFELKTGTGAQLSPGSSGSPVFNVDHQVIGQLHGGYASCTSQTSDWYGKFSVSFVAGLSNHLDIAGSGQLTLNTLPGTGMSINPGDDVLHVCTSPCVNPDPSEVLYTMVNNSPDTITYQVETVNNAGFILVDGGNSTNGFLASGNSVTVLISVNASGMSDGLHEEIVRFIDLTNARNVDRHHTLDIGSTEFTTNS